MILLLNPSILLLIRTSLFGLVGFYSINYIDKWLKKLLDKMLKIRYNSVLKIWKFIQISQRNEMTMVTKSVTRQEVDGFLGIDTQINCSDNPLEEAVEILTDLINGDYSVDQLRRDMHEWKDTWTVITPKERPAPMPPMSPFFK